MSLGSLVQWQSALLSVAGIAQTVSCHELEIPVTVVATALIGLMVYFRVEYTDGGVIATLALLETPTTVDASELEKAENEPGDGLSSDSAANPKPFLWRTVSAIGMPCLMGAVIYLLFHYKDGHYKDGNQLKTIILSQLLIVFNKVLTHIPDPDAITAQGSRARRHVQSQGTGFWSTYPGFAMFLVYMLLSSLINVPAKLWFHDKRIEFPLRLIWGIVLTNLHTAWVHIVISKPSTKSFWQRIPGWREWIEILPAASLDIILPSIVYHLLRKSLALIYVSYFSDVTGDTESTAYIEIVFMLPRALAYATSLITRAIYIRVAASMLPSEDEPLVPFDRSFGGQARTSQAYSLSIRNAGAVKAQSWNRYAKIIWETIGLELICMLGPIIAISAKLYFSTPCTLLGLLHLAVPRSITNI